MTMKPRPFILTETRWQMVRNTPYELAVLPWGATEAHNYHLPYGTDCLQCDFVAARAAEKAWKQKASVIVLPTIPFGVNTTQLDIPLTINMNPSTQLRVFRDVVESLHRQKIFKLLILNGHGGNDFKPIIREVQKEYRDMFLCLLNWYEVLSCEAYFAEPGDHAGEMETSVMMAIAPHLVGPLEEAGSGTSKKFKSKGLREGWVWAPRDWLKISRDTGVGDPRQATPDKGRRYFEDLTDAIASFLVELCNTGLDELYE